MKAHRVLPVFALLTVGLLTACSNAEPEAATPTVDPGPSAECLSAMSTAADEIDPVLADPLIAETAHACETAEEWEAALQEHPGAMGLNERADLSGALDIVCYSFPEAPACADLE